MKRFVGPALTTLLLIACVVILVLALASRQRPVTILTGNSDRRPLPMESGRFQDTQCAMPIEDLTHACQAVDENGRTWFFDDVGCLALWLERRGDRDRIVVWVRAPGSGDWIDGRRARYVRNAETAMGYGFAPAAGDEEGVDFETMTAMMARGENLTDPYVRKVILEDR